MSGGGTVVGGGVLSGTLSECSSARKRRSAEELSRLREEIASLDEDQFDQVLNTSSAASACSEVKCEPIVLAIVSEIVRVGTEVLRSSAGSPRPLVLIERLARLGIDVIGLSGETVSRACSNMSFNYGSQMSPGYGIPVSPTPAAMGPAENFGTTAIRELVSSLGRPRRRDASEIIAAIAAAKKAGLDEIAARLEAELELSKEPAPAVEASSEAAA